MASAQGISQLGLTRVREVLDERPRVKSHQRSDMFSL